MPLKDRQTLKNLFRKGSLPTQSSFTDIIDSSINKIDDGFSKSMDDGLMLAPIGESKKLLSLFKKITDKTPEWTININENLGNASPSKQLNFVNQNNDIPLLNLSDKGFIGVNTSNPKHELDVNGYVASKGRIGTVSEKTTVPANGEWHAILSDLNYCSGFEVMARVGVLKTGKHALLHAIAMSAYGNSHHRIRKTYARFSFWRPIRIKIRWTGTTYNYNLEIKTSKNLGQDVLIKYNISQLWDDEGMGIPEHYMKTEHT